MKRKPLYLSQQTTKQKFTTMKTYQMTQINEVLKVSKNINVQTARTMTLARAERLDTTLTTKTVTEEFLNNCIDKEAIKFFEDLGGREDVRQLLDGVEVISYSPNFEGTVQVTTRIFKES